MRRNILPGSHSTVRVPANVLEKMLTLPDNTLIVGGKDPQVAVVDAKGVVQFREVRLGRPFGVQSEILSGVTESDEVIVNPSDSLVSGLVVHVSSSAPQVATK
jgi:multidrug efflux pump subunit AcrA (membrane-fusion protein)